MVKLTRNELITLSNNCRVCISTHKVNNEYSMTDDIINFLNKYKYTTKHVIDHKEWIYGEKS